MTPSSPSPALQEFFDHFADLSEEFQENPYLPPSLIADVRDRLELKKGEKIHLAQEKRAVLATVKTDGTIWPEVKTVDGETILLTRLVRWGHTHRDLLRREATEVAARTFSDFFGGSDRARNAAPFFIGNSREMGCRLSKLLTFFVSLEDESFESFQARESIFPEPFTQAFQDELTELFDHAAAIAFPLRTSMKDPTADSVSIAVTEARMEKLCRAFVDERREELGTLHRMAHSEKSLESALRTAGILGDVR
jgi:hypothetical protein